jgi:hypothetical protein
MTTLPLPWYYSSSSLWPLMFCMLQVSGPANSSTMYSVYVYLSPVWQCLYSLLVKSGISFDWLINWMYVIFLLTSMNQTIPYVCEGACINNAVSGILLIWSGEKLAEVLLLTLVCNIFVLSLEVLINILFFYLCENMLYLQYSWSWIKRYYLVKHRQLLLMFIILWHKSLPEVM